jgi:hypothetical protein
MQVVTLYTAGKGRISMELMAKPTGRTQTRHHLGYRLEHLPVTLATNLATTSKDRLLQTNPRKPGLTTERIRT